MSSAIEVTDLYVAKIEVSSQSSKERGQALKSALASVFLKVGGQQQVLSQPEIRSALSRYNHYLSKYHYEKKADQNYLVATFDEIKINQLFINSNISLWGSLRPQVLFWIVNEDGLSRKIVSGSNSPEIQQQLLSFSQKRGLPILMPLMDLTDANMISISDVWGRFSGPIIQASNRYLAETVIALRISNRSLLSEQELQTAESCPLCQPSFVLDWYLVSDASNASSFNVGQSYQGLDKEVLLSQALSDITDEIYQNYALSSDESNEYIIDVANVTSLTIYTELTEFLTQLSSVQSIQLLSAQGDNRRFKLTLLGSKQALMSSLKLNQSLKQAYDPLGPVVEDAVPVFYWSKL
ncbi:DUF2066 domain-containing protein [Thalassotalea profundi]|uniref:DUF2066 domain-containing protein n=1 Tax=Thalassotalea profundi TaxID=2036687 RepID=A0ABQ3J167_9GAMM|nr:DUF2066 domain-containing protein [Thalassotalea profundi]GHE97919.1 hypothetical protein GCM10011501_29270 [Thalassotalea profundi]